MQQTTLLNAQVGADPTPDGQVMMHITMQDEPRVFLVPMPKAAAEFLSKRLANPDVTIPPPQQIVVPR